MAEPTSIAAGRIQRRRRRRWAVRVLLVLILLLVTAYAALPVWMPTSWLTRRLTDQLSADLNRPVRIGAIHLGWGRGIILEELAVGERSGLPNALLMRASRIRCPFSPLTTLVTGKVDRLEIDDPEFWLVFDEDGRLVNLDDLGRSENRRLPSLHYVIRRAACHVLTPRAAQTFRIDELDCRLEPETGLLRLTGEAVAFRAGLGAGTPAEARLTLDAAVTIPRLKHDETLHGDVHVRWDDLALTDLPLPLVTPLPIEQVDGVTTGELSFTAHPDLGIDYELSIAFDGVRILRRGFDRPAQVPDAALHCNGHWDPHTDTLRMQEFDYDTRAIHVRRLLEPARPEAPAMLIDPKGDTPFALHLAGRVKDWPALRRELPEVNAFAKAVGATVTGSADWTVAFTQGHDQDHLRLTVDGLQSEWRLADGDTRYLSAEVGRPKQLQVEVVHGRRGSPRSRADVTVTVGDLSLITRSELTLPRSELPIDDPVRWLADVLPTLRMNLAVETAHVEQTVALFPFAAKLADTADWRGPLSLKASITPGEGISELRLAARMNPKTALAIGDWFDKPAGQELTATANLSLPHRADGRVDNLAVQLTHGQSTLSVGPKRAWLDYRLAFANEPGPRPPADVGPVDRPIVIDSSVELPLRVQHIEDLLSLFPRWRRWLSSRPGNELTGSADIVARSSFSRRPDDWVVCSEVEIAADDLTIRWNDQVDKPAGQALVLRAFHRWHVVHGRGEQSLGGALRQPAGELTGAITFAGGEADDHGNDFEHVSIRADIDDLAAFMAIAPALSRRVTPFRPSGSASLNIDSLLLEGEQTVSVSADATNAGFVIPDGTPISKPLGVPAELRFQWRSDLTDMGAGRQSWSLREGFIRLAGAEITDLSGSVVTGWEAAASGPPVLTRHVVGLESASLHARGRLTFDESFARLHPELARWRQALDLSGAAGWDIEARLEPEVLEIKGHIDAGEMNLSLDLDSDVVPVVHKPPAKPMKVAFDLAVQQLHDIHAYRIDCKESSIDLDNNRVAVDGTLFLDRDGQARLEFDDFALTATCELLRPHSVLALLPGSRIQLLEGEGQARFELAGSGPEVAFEPAELDFHRLTIDFGSGPIRLDGRVTFDQTHTNIEQLGWAWGPSGGVVSGRVERLADGRIREGRIGLAFDHVDVPDLRDRLASLARLRPPTPRIGEGASSSAEPGPFAELIDRLREADLKADVHIGSIEVPLPLDVDVLADAVANRLSLEQGQLELAFSALVDGGSVTGSLTSNLTVNDPTFHLTYTARRIKPGAVVDQYLTRTFPGMKAHGPLTLIDESYQKLLPAKDQPSFDVGQGELFIEGGTIEGRAAPVYMTRIFPGLNLARFEFSYMHSWFDKLPSGRIHHQMIFQGGIYNIYMVGYGDPDGHMSYEVGIDFFADFDSRYWADVGQGRIPLFVKTGKIQPDGTLADERVDYVPRRFIESLLVRTNPVVTAYHAVRKRVLGEK